jgi:hypothetical protein
MVFSALAKLLRRGRGAALVAAVAVLSIVMAVPALADRNDRRVKIINETNTPVYHFYGSNAGSESWEEDILGREVLMPGKSVVINFDDGSGYCKFDFKIVFKDKTEIVRENIDVCKVEVYRLTGD